jgi:hypothetical protein
MGYPRNYLLIRNSVVEPAMLGSIKNMGSATTTTTTAITASGNGTLTLANVGSIAVGEMAQTGTLIPPGTTIKSINTAAKTAIMSANATGSIAVGATISFTLPAITGFNAAADTTTVSPTQTAMHITLSSKAGPNANVSMSPSSLLNLGQAIANDFAITNGHSAALQSVAALNHQVKVELMVNA